MTRLSLGKIRGLQAIGDPDGRFTMVAIDQRLSLARILCPQAPHSIGFETLRDVKVDLALEFSRRATAILVDVEYGLGEVIATGALAGHCGLLAALEAEPARRTRRREGWTVAKIRAAGADAVKLLVLYNPDDVESAAHQRRLVAEVVAECAEHDILCVVESVGYDVAPKARAGSVLRTAEELVPLGPDLYKAEFPGDLESCRRLDELCGETPWVILSAGAPIDAFERQVEVACRAGASGFLAGRALWQDAVAEPDREARRRRLATESAANFDRVARLVAAHGRPWTERFDVRAAAGALEEGWYRDYREPVRQ